MTSRNSRPAPSGWHELHTSIPAACDHRRVGVDTHFYLLDFERYTNEVSPLLDQLLRGGDLEPARLAYADAIRILAQASKDREYPWTPFHQGDSTTPAELEGRFPDAYYGDRETRGIMDPDAVTHDPQVVRDYSLRDNVCAPIVEGLCVPWNLDFPPVHVVTWCLGWDLYRHSKRFEYALCTGEIDTRSQALDYEINAGDRLVDRALTGELAAEIERIAPPGSKPWEQDAYSNLYLLLQKATEPRYRLVVSLI